MLHSSNVLYQSFEEKACFFFSDVDECDANQNECHSNAICTNTFSSYVCRCLKGYQGDGRICEGNIEEKYFKLWLTRDGQTSSHLTRLLLSGQWMKLK